MLIIVITCKKYKNIAKKCKMRCSFCLLDNIIFVSLNISKFQFHSSLYITWIFTRNSVCLQTLVRILFHTPRGHSNRRIFSIHLHFSNFDRSFMKIASQRTFMKIVRMIALVLLCKQKLHQIQSASGELYLNPLNDNKKEKTQNLTKIS